MSGAPHVKCDFFMDINGQEHICEVYTTEDGYAIEYDICPLLDDGSKGEPIEEPSEEQDEYVQQQYYEWATTTFGDEVI